MKCFADHGISCDALREEICEGCKFYKSIKSQIDVLIKEIQSYKDCISKQSLKTLIGQAKAGDINGARIGLKRVKKQGGL